MTKNDQWPPPGITPVARRASRQRLRKLSKLCDMLNFVESGRADQLFADDVTKQYFVADLNAEASALITAELEAFPGVFERCPGDRWRLRKAVAVTPIK